MGGRHAFAVPAARGIVLGQHFGQHVDLAFGRTGLGGFRQQALGQRIVGLGEAGGIVEFTLHVPDALANFLQLLGGELLAAGRLNLGRHIGKTPGKGGENADPGRVESRRCILKSLDQFGLAFMRQRIGLDRNAQHFRGNGVAAQMAAAAVGGGIGQSDALDGAAVIGRKLLALGRHRQIGIAIFGRQALGALADFLAEAPAVNGFFRQESQRCRRSERRGNAELPLSQHAHFIELHHRAQRGAKADRVDAFLVAQHGHVLQRFQVLHAVGRAQRPGGFVFEPARRAPVLRLVRHGEMALVHLADAATGNGAAEAGLIRDQLGLAVGVARRGHGFGRNVLGAFKLHVLVVAGRQAADFIDDIHQHLGAEGGQALAGDGVVMQDFFLLKGDLHECLGVADIAHALGATHRNRFQVLAAHHGPHARAAGGAVQVVHHGGIQHAVFTRLANAGNACQRVLQALLEQGLGLPDALAPEPGGIAQLGRVVVDVEVHRRRRLALENHHVPAGHLEFGTPVAA